MNLTNSVKSKWKKYRAYKNSGVEWLGEVPTTWEVRSIKRESLVKRGASPRPIDDPKYFDDNGEYAWVRIADVTASNIFLEQTTQKLSDLGASLSIKLEPGEIFLSIAGSVGKPCLTNIKCCIHDGFVYFPNLKGNKKFLYYIFESGQPYKGLGKLGTQLNLNTDIVGDIKIAFPSLQEQQLIVEFIDRETVKLEELINKKQRLIELLKEKRQALVTQAVTKGLNPDVPMKDSGVKWIGRVPAHWNVKRIKWVAQMESGHTPNKKEQAYWENGDIPWVSLNDSKFLKDHDYISETAYYTTKLGIANSSARILPENSVIFSRDASVGLCAITLRPMAISQHFIAWICGYEITAEYLLYVLKCMTQELDRLAWGATVKTIGMPDIKVLSAPIPTKDEQEMIISYIKEKTIRIGSTIEKLKMQIAKIQEYRQALITAAVTGQIDVREEGTA
ncbi:restriction endonuclease subunit S [Paenibacillus sp. TRM 82003]|nr:restriction endonuclease subunit S [Paenibacillus sp. TRM 82003]